MPQTKSDIKCKNSSSSNNSNSSNNNSTIITIATMNSHTTSAVAASIRTYSWSSASAGASLKIAIISAARFSDWRARFGFRKALALPNR